MTTIIWILWMSFPSGRWSPVTAFETFAACRTAVAAYYAKADRAPNNSMTCFPHTFDPRDKDARP